MKAVHGVRGQADTLEDDQRGRREGMVQVRLVLQP